MRTVKVTGIAILTVGTAAVFVAVKAGLSPHEHFKRTAAAVSYTHLDVYKRQSLGLSAMLFASALSALFDNRLYLLFH